MQWGHLVRTGVIKRDFRQISINNIITLGTRIRIIILKVYLCPNMRLRRDYDALVPTMVLFCSLGNGRRLS